MIGLRFPTEVGAGGSDFVTFTPMKYKSNASGGAMAPAGGGAQAITLYMPNLSLIHISEPTRPY